MISLIVAALTGGGIVLVVILIIIHYFEKFEKLFSHILSLVRWGSVYIDKQATKRDLQGRTNDFIKRLDKKIYNFVPPRMEVQFHNDESIEGFENEGTYLIRMKKDIDPNKNFVNVVMFFTSNYVLLKAKKQISKKQKESLDLFIAKNLLQEEKESVMSEFVDHFLQPKADDEKIRDFFNKYTNIDKYGLFFPVFLQEMTFLGERVFADPKDRTIQQEVSDLIDFLSNYSRRLSGQDNTESVFKGEFSRFAIVLVGNSEIVGDDAYINNTSDYISTLMNEGMESIYLIGSDTRYKHLIIRISEDVLSSNTDYEVLNQETYPAEIRNRANKIINVKTFLLVLRKQNPDPFIQN